MDSIIRKHKSKPQSRRYFTKETEAAIVKYNNSFDSLEAFDMNQPLYEHVCSNYFSHFNDRI